jgi:hypothetical protein
LELSKFQALVLRSLIVLLKNKNEVSGYEIQAAIRDLEFALYMDEE